MSRYEVMQAEYKAVTGENPSNFIRDELPVESVSWLDAVRYCRSQLEGLPTEAEWNMPAVGTDGWQRMRLWVKHCPFTTPAVPR